MLIYSQTTGLMTLNSKPLAEGWAGKGDSKNNPKAQEIHDEGPLPRGLYEIGEWGLHDVGPMSARLTQVSGDTFGRDGFYIHGPAQDPAHYGQESKGCIVIPRPKRLLVAASGEKQVLVTA